jgi:hypothetical protein
MLCRDLNNAVDVYFNNGYGEMMAVAAKTDANKIT